MKLRLERFEEGSGKVMHLGIADEGPTLGGYTVL